MENGGKSLDTVFVRPGRQVDAGAVHAAQRPKPMLMFLILLAVGSVYVVLRISNDQSRADPNARMKPIEAYVASSPTLRPTPFNVEMLKTAAPVVVVTVMVVTGTPVPSKVPTQTPFVVTVTMQPAKLPSVTPLPNLKLIIHSYWPKKGWGRAKTALGLSPADVENRGAACPDVLPLGSVILWAAPDALRVPNKFTCVDRGRLGCDGGICSVLLYSREPISGLFDAWVEYKP